MSRRRRRIAVIQPAGTLLVALAGCVMTHCAYYNTFYNAQVQYHDGVKLVEANNPGSAKGKFESAIKKSAAVITNYPKSSWVDDALFMIGACYYQLGDYPKAIAKFENLEAVFPRSNLRNEARFYLALSLINDRQYAKGIGLLKALKDSSRRFREDAAFEVATTSFKQGDYDAAIRGLHAYRAEFPHSSKERALQQLLAESYFNLGDYQHAAEAFCEHRKSASHSRERVPDDLSVAECYLLGKQPDSALALMQRQTDRFPEYADRFNLITGKALLELARKPDAILALTKVKAGSYAAEAYFLIGQSQEQDTNFSAALAYYDTVRLRAPNSVYASQANSRRLLIARLLQGMKGEGDTAQVKFLLAEVYHLNLKQDSLAVLHYRRVSDSFPKSPYAPKALYAVAWIKQNRLKESDSLLAYEQVVDRFPKTVYAQQARVVLGQPLLAEREIEKPPALLSARAESIKAKIISDSLAAQKTRADSLARLAQQPTPTPPSPPLAPVSERGERGRDRREHREKTARPPEAGPLVSESLGAKKPVVPSESVAPADTSHKPSPPPPPAYPPPPRIDTTHTPIMPITYPTPEPMPLKPPAPPAPGTSHESVLPPARPGSESIALMPSPSPPLPETGLKQLPGVSVTPKPETLAKPVPQTPETVAPKKPEKQLPLPPGSVFLPDTNLALIYFDFDKASIHLRDTLILKANAQYLAQHTQLQVQLAGFCDPRGSEEYNDLLGLRRAETVRQWLLKLGVDDRRVQIASFGKTRVKTDDPALYWTERRCEFWTIRP